MPVVQLTTNVKLGSEDETKAFVAGFSKFCAKTIGKDEKYFSIKFEYNPYLTFAGTFEPAIMLTTMSLDNTNPTNSQIWSKGFAQYFKDKLGVRSDRGYMAFLDPGAAFIGIGGTTVEAMRAAANL